MTTKLLSMRELPEYENLWAVAKRHPDIDPDAVAAYLRLVQVAGDLAAAGEKYLAEHAISRGRLTVLMILNSSKNKGLCPADLADKAHVTRATMTGLIDGLEGDEMVARQGHVEDRRRLMVYLTPLGKTFLSRVLPGYVRGMARLMAPLGEKEKGQLGELLGTLSAGGFEAAKRGAMKEVKRPKVKRPKART